MDLKELADLLNEERDSVELSTPAKGGAIKCYGNADKPELFKEKLKRMVEVRNFGRDLLEGVKTE
jgi:hypothetical protein